MMGQRGIMSYMIALIIIITLMLILWAVVLPLLQQIQVTTFSAQQNIMSDTNETIQALPNSTTKTAILTSFNAGLNSAETNFDIISFFIQYWWVFLLVIVSFGTYLLARRNVEFQGGF
jgi:hypothetical protein